MKRVNHPAFPALPKLIILGLAAAVIAFTAYATATPAADRSAPSDDSLVVVAVGDIACSPQDPDFNSGRGARGKCQQAAVVNAINQEPRVDVLLLLGDIQYQFGEYDNYMKSFAPVWSRVKARLVMTVPGNHDYGQGNIDNYLDAMPQTFGLRYINFPNRSYGSVQIKNWLLVGLDSDCEVLGGCNPSDPQGKWLASSLADFKGNCTLSFWHYPVFSSGRNAALNMRPSWSMIENAGGDVVLAGHEHLYERFSRQSVYGDAGSGMRQFIVGTGGRDLHQFVRPFHENHETGISKYGYLKMVLKDNSYNWQFINPEGEALDSGSDNCHSAEPAQSNRTPAAITPGNEQSYSEDKDEHEHTIE